MSIKQSKMDTTGLHDFNGSHECTLSPYQSPSSIFPLSFFAPLANQRNAHLNLTGSVLLQNRFVVSWICYTYNTTDILNMSNRSYLKPNCAFNHTRSITNDCVLAAVNHAREPMNLDKMARSLPITTHTDAGVHLTSHLLLPETSTSETPSFSRVRALFN